jgi:hypothetical protein
MSPLLESDLDSLRKAPDYRTFLQAYLDTREISLSDLARAAGFGRGFPGDVISGRRRLTARSYRAFEGALKIPPSGKRYFRLLVAREERDLFPELKPESVERGISELRNREWVRSRRELPERTNPSVSEVMRDRNCLAVYAAAGSPGSGATHEQLAQRTRLSNEEVKKAITLLIKAGVVEESAGRVFPKDLHVALKSVGTGAAFSALFQSACKAAAARSLSAVPSENELFFTSSFGIDETRLPELKAALRSVILKFVDESIEPEGNRVVHLTTGLHL